MAVVVSPLGSSGSGLFNSAIPGLHPVPKPTALPITFKEGFSPLLEERLMALPVVSLPPESVMRARVMGASVRMSYILRAIRNGDIVQEDAIGRTWEPNPCVSVVFPPSAGYGNGSVSMHPGLAALSEEIMDRHALTALGNVSGIFGNVRSTQLTTEARAAFRSLPRMPVNHTRFLFRLAALWWGAKIAEARGGVLQYRGSHSAGAVVEHAVDSVAGFCALLEDGHRYQQNIVYFETTSLGDWSEDLECILRIACDPRPNWRTEGGVHAGVLGVWPDIHSLAYASLRGHALRAVVNLDVRPAAVWEAAVTYSRQHGVTDNWLEAVESIGALALRPDGTQEMLLGERAMFPLPEAAMQACALDPALASMRSWLNLTAAPVEPEYYEVAWQGCVRYMLWELSCSSVLMLGGLRDALLPNAPPRLKSSLRVMLQAQMGSAPFIHHVLEVGRALGFPNLLGRTLRRIAFEAHSNALEHLWARAPSWIQWEEALPITNICPTSASIYGLLKPVALATLDVFGRWCHVGYIQGREGIQDALYSLRNYGPIEIKAAVRDAATGMTTITDLPLVATSYRGQPLDHMYGRLLYQNSTTAEPVFRITDHRTLFRSVQGAKERAEWQWFFSWM